MTDESFTFEQMWTSYEGGMESAHRESVRAQVFSIVKDGISLAGASELLTGAPAAEKEAVWAAWAADADVSGYLLKDILALGTTETAECVYPIVSRWVSTANMTKYSVKDILKICEALPVYDDVLKVWRHYAQSADLRKYRLIEVAYLMYRCNDAEAQITIGTRWLAQVGERGIRELKFITDRDIDKINSYNLPQEVIDVWIAAKKS
jgi:hypothetical protein